MDRKMDTKKDILTCVTVKEIMSEDCGATAISVSRDLIANTVSVWQTINNVPPEKPLDSIIFNVQKPIATFSGRVNFLEDLHKTLKENSMAVLTQQAALPVIAATGGIGKTETVRMYIEQAKKAGIYKHIIWIDADPHSTAQNQFRRLATQLKIPVFECPDRTQPIPLEEIAPQVYELLCKTSAVLVVFDNAEALQDDEEMGIQGIEELLPPSLSPHCINPVILVTSRNQNWELQNVIELELWTPEECTAFLLSILQLPRTPETIKTAGDLSDLFGRLPIALQAAVAVIIQQKKRRRTIAVGGNYTMEDLINDYRTGTAKRGVLESKPLNQKKQTPMMTLWTVTKEKIREMDHGPLAIDILNRMAFMSPTKIPKTFLKTVLQGPQEASPDDESLSVALTLLIDYSLVTELEDSYTMHRMIQDVTIEHLKSITDQDFVTILLELSREMTKVIHSLNQSAKNEDVVANAVQLAKHTFPYLITDEFREYTFLVGSYQHRSFRYKSALDLYEKVLRASNQLFGSNHEETLKIKSKMAAALTDTGDFQAGKKVYLEVLSVQMKALGPDHLLTLGTENDIGEILWKEGKHEEALTLFSSILERREKLRDVRSAGAVHTKGSLIRLLTSRGEFRKALALTSDFEVENVSGTPEAPDVVFNRLQTHLVLQKSLSDHTQRDIQLGTILEMLDVGESSKRIDLETWASRHLTRFLREQGQVQKTIEIYEKLLEKQKRLLGSQDPWYLETKCNLASALSMTGDSERALEVHSEVLEEREKIFGPHHAQTLQSKCAIAGALQDQSKLQEALEMFQDVLRIWEELQEPTHVNILHTKRMITSVFQDQRNFEGALAMHFEVLRGEVERLGANHPDVVDTQFNIGTFYCQEGKYLRATRLAHDVLFHLPVDFIPQFLKHAKLLLTSWTSLITASIPDPPNHHELVAQIVETTHLHPDSAWPLLQATDWNIQLALQQLQDVNDSNTFKLRQYVYLCLPLFHSNRDKFLELAWQQFQEASSSDTQVKTTTNFDLVSRLKERIAAKEDRMQSIPAFKAVDPSEADSVSENVSIDAEDVDGAVVDELRSDLAEMEVNFAAVMEDIEDTMGMIRDCNRGLERDHAYASLETRIRVESFLRSQAQDLQNLQLSTSLDRNISNVIASYLENLRSGLVAELERSPAVDLLDKNQLVSYFAVLAGATIIKGHALFDNQGDRKPDVFVWLRYLPGHDSPMTDEAGEVREGQTTSSVSLPLNSLKPVQPPMEVESESEKNSDDALGTGIFWFPDLNALARKLKSAATASGVLTDSSTSN